MTVEQLPGQITVHEAICAGRTLHPKPAEVRARGRRLRPHGDRASRASQLLDAQVDHNHETGAVRALLCGLCNAGIGRLRDDPAICISAAMYVRARGSAGVMLTLELVPSTSWGDNLRSRLSRSEWDVVRRKTYRDANFVCEICGGVGSRHPVEAHERWEYDDARKIQTLVGMIALCPTCHRAKHIGRTLSVESEATQDRVLAHIKAVNHWTDSLLLRELDKAFAQHAERSQHQWTLDISWIEHVIGRKL